MRKGYFVIDIKGTSGSGKSTLARALARGLEDAAVLYLVGILCHAERERSI
jgi:uridine kinase